MEGISVYEFEILDSYVIIWSQLTRGLFTDKVDCKRIKMSTALA